MLFRHRLLILCVPVFSLLTSCSPAVSAQEPAQTLSSVVLPSPTPFQPGTDEFSPLTPLPPSVVMMFTPYLLPQVRGGLQTAPAVATPSGDAASSSTYDPLTGLIVSDPSILDRRPLVIKISNYPRAIRPQYGLNSADQVFEYYIEWLDTRFIAVYYGNNARQIGPVRSGRYFDEHITRMYHAYYVFNYADPREFNYFLGGDLQKFVVVPGYGDCPPFFQFKVSSQIIDVRHYETYFDSTRFSDCLARTDADNSRQTLRSGFFSAATPSSGHKVDRIFTHYSKCDYNYWEYDPDSGRYLRYQEVSRIQTPAHLDDCSDTPETYAPLTDALTQKQVAADNVVELFVSHTFANQNEQDDEVYHINLIDSGNAFVFRDGQGYPARWMRTDIDQPLLITTPSGVPFYMKPGTTFYEVIGETSNDWSENADWHFEFHTP
jgi:hypothetical protein